MSNSSIQFQTSLNKAMRGDPIEQYMVGHFYKNGIGVSVDNGKAKEFSDLALAKLKEIQKLAEKGNAQAQFVWGNVHASGQGVRQNDKTAAIWYKKAAKQGNPEAQYYLGFMYQKGLGVKKNIDEAVNWYRIAAERGNASGQCNLGHMYEKGLGVQLNNDEALKWYRKAAEQNNAAGQNSLGFMYEKGLGVQQNYDEAVKWYIKAAEQGNAEGQCSLGRMHRKGHGVQQNYDEALKWLTKAAEQENASAQIELGLLYQFNRSGQQNYGEALKWYSKAAEQGDASGQTHLGFMYEKGLGVQKNLDEAVKWYTKAAEQGNASGQLNLGDMYEKGLGVQKNLSKAVKWYRKAAEQGYVYGQTYLATMYEKGLGVQKNLGEALKWYTKAAEQGGASEQIRLGELYKEGSLGQQSYREAMKWYRKAAEQGDERGHMHLGDMYKDGLGVEKNIHEALQWYRKAAKKGGIWAQTKLGNMYQNDLGGVQQSYIEAVKWFTKAAEQGNKYAQNSLGRLYEKGLGVQQNYAEALKWYKKAAEQGYSLGQKNLGEMYCYGRGVQQDYVEAVKWYKKAAIFDWKMSEDCGDASNNLGLMYEKGLGVEQLYVRAVDHYKEACKKRHADGQVNLKRMYLNNLGIVKSIDEGEIECSRKYAAQGDAYELGWMYEMGLLVQQDYDHAMRLYRAAAEKGCAWSQLGLGDMYYNGHGVQKNFDQALNWYRKAAKHQNGLAQSRLEQMFKQSLDTQQSNNHIIQESTKKLLEQRKTQEQNDKTSILTTPTPTPQKVIFVQPTRINEPVKPSQEKKFKETPELETTEDSDYHETLLSQHWEINSDDLKDKVEVGAGGCGKVYRGLWQGSPVAIKELHGRLGPAELEELRKEALIMSQLHHPHVIHLFGITHASPHCLVMEWMEKGSFYEVLRKDQLNFEQKGKVLLGAARGLAFLHSKNMIHRDIKSLNILLKKSYKAKIGDFGLSQVKKSLRSQSKHGSSAGTIHWKAPELFKLGGKHTPASDVYAFGIVMWEALTGKDPYEEAEDVIQITYYVQEGGRLEIPQGTPQWYRELMERCWSQNPQDRPKAEEVAFIIEKMLSEEQPLSPAQFSQSNPSSSGYLLQSHKPADKSASRIPLCSGYLDLD